MEANEKAKVHPATEPPEEFRFSVGGFNSPGFRVESFRGTFIYGASYMGTSFGRESYSDGLDQDTYNYVQRALESDDEQFRTTALSLVESNVEPTRRILYYLRFGFEPPSSPFPPIEPNWPELLAELNRVDAWNWREDYLNPNILDGTGWSLMIRWGGKTIKSGGRNAYPQDADGTRAPYDGLIAAIREQIGGRALF